MADSAHGEVRAMTMEEASLRMVTTYVETSSISEAVMAGNATFTAVSKGATETPSATAAKASRSATSIQADITWPVPLTVRKHASNPTVIQGTMPGLKTLPLILSYHFDLEFELGSVGVLHPAPDFLYQPQDLMRRGPATVDNPIRMD